MKDYDRIVQIIHRLDKIHAQHPKDQDSRAHLNSPYFQNLFARWGAITPENFFHCLSFSYAKERLRAGANALKTSFRSQSNRSRHLHFHFEIVTPKMQLSENESQILFAGFASTPFGRGLLVECPQGICHFSFVDSSIGTRSLAGLRRNWPRAIIHRDDSRAAKLAAAIFKNSADLRIFVRGTVFQIRVWRALLQIPRGTLVSYENLASILGCHSAARAVGTAVGCNSLAYLIPCHRVIRKNGFVGEYRWGSVRKRMLLAWESSFCGIRKSPSRQKS